MEKFFQFEAHNTSLKTEIRAGTTTFMTMAYIIFVNPFILSQAGMDYGAVMTATIIASGVTTILMGLLTNYPFALASGMGLNAFFTYFIAAEFGWQTALGAVFISGVVFLLLSLSGGIAFIDKAVPVSLKSAVAVGIGLFIAFIGLQNGEIIVSDPATQVTMGDLGQAGPQVALLGILIISVLMARRIRGAILLGILLTTVVSFFFGLQDLPQSAGAVVGPPVSMAPTFLQLDLRGALAIPFFVIFSLVFVDIFNTMGTLLGTGARAGYLDKDGCLPKVNRAMLADAVGTMGGAALGTSTVTTYIESSAGISDGGRTGFTSVVTGLLFFLALFFAPLAQLIPPQATAPALVVVGLMMAGEVKKINFEDFTEAMPAFLAMIFMPLAYSIADSIAVGLLSFPIIKVVAGRRREVHWLLYILALVSLVHLFFSL